jgi:hypothetical protein
MPGNNARNTTLGFALAGAGAILFATKGVFSKALWASGVDYLTVTALRAVLALPMFAVLALWRGMSLRRAPPVRGAAGGAGRRCATASALLDFRAGADRREPGARAMFSYPALIVTGMPSSSACCRGRRCCSRWA